MTNMNSNKKTNKIIKVNGARQHNLKGVSVEIPRNRLTVITGVSGSGKSSLAFDTIYAEGQRRFVESLSAYARQFLERMGKPDCDSITGLPPAIAIEQRTSSKNPRSTVGTTTEIYDYLRLLFARIGKTICWKCGEEVKKDSPQSALESIMKWGIGEKIYIMINLPARINSVKEELDRFRSKGFFRVVVGDSDEIINLETDKLPKSTIPEDIHIIVDRLKTKDDKDSISRLTDSLETAFKQGNGRIAVRNIQSNEEKRYSSIYECADCEIVYAEPTPRLFSFNNPNGACPTCQGFGRTLGIDENLVFPDKSRSLKNNAIHPFRTQGHSKHLRALMKIAPKYNIPVDKPIHSLNDEQMKIVMDGKEQYKGVNGFFKLLEEKSYKLHYRVMLSRYRGYTKCYACHGSRLRTSARQVFINGKNIPELINMQLDELSLYFQNISLTKNEKIISGQILNEINWRLDLLINIGLEYLTLSRLTHTLSGGESQRINLATALGSSLVDTLYVLDEPSIGMHPRDTGRLLNILFKLRNLGNTIIVVEHDFDIIKKADLIIDLGPNAGEQGGELVFKGTFDELQKDRTSLTGQYFSGEKFIKIPEKRSEGNGKKISVFNASEHNLDIQQVDFPLGLINVVTGVSGSGKSTLVHDVLYAGMKKHRGGFLGHTGSFERIEGHEHIEHIELVDHSPIGKSSRSTPATYTKVFDAIRDIFSQTQAARQFGWKPGHFSFNVSGGRCDVCEGEGFVTVDMQFLPDVQLECEACKGTRYKKEVRNVYFNGKSIVDVLNMTVDQAAKFFKDIYKIKKKLQLLQDVGLGYLRLGQPSTMLSGGEAQRIKLASHLESNKRADTVFIFDEPTTGLHVDDISKLIECFRKLISKGHSVIIIEHNLHVIASSDWVIDLGPEAGDKGGKIVTTGTPEQVAKNKSSLTGLALKEFFQE